MTLDLIIGLLIGLASVCAGGLITMLAMYYRAESRDDRNGPPRWEDFDQPLPDPQTDPAVRIPDFVPREWLEEKAA
jgi:hypothetical protein